MNQDFTELVKRIDAMQAQLSTMYSSENYALAERVETLEKQNQSLKEKASKQLSDSDVTTLINNKVASLMTAKLAANNDGMAEAVASALFKSGQEAEDAVDARFKSSESTIAETNIVARQSLEVATDTLAAAGLYFSAGE